LSSRQIRAAILGYPNVGKSALINRLAGRRKAKSENRAGVTRHLGWVTSRARRARVPPARASTPAS